MLEMVFVVQEVLIYAERKVEVMMFDDGMFGRWKVEVSVHIQLCEIGEGQKY